MSKTEVGLGWRLLDPNEPVEEGDEYLSGGQWKPSDNWCCSWNTRREQMKDTPYRRRMVFKPCSYLNPVVPPVKTHVVWAETPVQIHMPKDHMDADPGEGYRLVQHGEFIEEGDQWWDPDLGAWGIFTGLSLASKTKHCIKSPLRRKLPVAQPAPLPGAGYRPYANAAEAAKALEGKLITHIAGIYWHPVIWVGNVEVLFNGSHIKFSELSKSYKFTDGTPCGIKTN